MKIDYTKIKLPEPARDRVQSARLPKKVIYDLKVIARLMNQTVSKLVSAAVYEYLSNNEDIHTQYLELEASSSKTVEEVYLELALGEDFDN